MFALDRLTLDAPRRTSDGYMAVRANAARTGVYDYLAGEVGAPDTFKTTDTVKIYRDAAEVFARDSVQSFVNKPITLGHPSKGVNASNWRDTAVGNVARAGRNEIGDGDFLAFDLVLMDAKAIAAVDGGERELSNGYECQLDWTPGITADGLAYDARQTNIRGNHVAIVPKGRAGTNCAIKDGFAVCDANPAALSAFTMEDRVSETITRDGLPVNLGDVAAVKALLAKDAAALTDAAAKLAAAETNLATVTTDKAALVAKVATLETQLADAKVTPAQLRDAAKAYQAVLDKAKSLGVATTDAMDESAIRKAVVSAKLGDAAKDWTDAQIGASFDTLAVDNKVQNIAPAANVADAATKEAAALRDANDHNAWRKQA